MSASRAGLTRRERVPLRPSASWRSRLCRLCAVTPRLTRAIESALLQIREKPTDLRRVLAADDGLARVAPRAPGRLELEVVPAPRLDPDHLAAAGDPDPLRRGFVALDL